jgi:hypothetical protein
MIPNAYLYVITERYPKSGTLRLNENMPQFICQTEDEAKFIIEDLKRLADISFAVIHERAKRRRTTSRSELVNNCAASHNGAGGRPALARSRSRLAYPKRVSFRLPAEPAALAPTSNRKSPPEGHYISLMDSRAKRRKNQQKTMNESGQWQQHRAFGALDWASEKHSVIVVDQAGKVIEDFEIEHSALGWKKFREKLQPYGSIPLRSRPARELRSSNSWRPV